MAVDKSLMSGSMTMLLLRLLAEKDMYGYEMIDTLRKKSCIRCCMGWKRRACLRYMSRNMQARRGSITVLRKRAENYWKQKNRSGWNINPRSPVFWQWGYKDGDIFGKIVVTDPL